VVERPRVCTSIPAYDLSRLRLDVERAFSHGSDYVEVRFDYLPHLDFNRLREALQNYVERCIYTCRRGDEGGRFRGSEESRIEALKRLATHRPAYIDIEMAAVKERPETVDELRSGGSKIIVSSHNFSETPSIDVLKAVFKEAARLGDCVKIVTSANRFGDNASILSLYRSAEKGRLIAFCMGELGAISRVICPLLGSPFTYASLDCEQTAPGQIPLADLREIYELL